MDSLDKPTRNRLWNSIEPLLPGRPRFEVAWPYEYVFDTYYKFARRTWPLDEEHARLSLGKHLQTSPYHEVFDVIEIFAQSLASEREAGDWRLTVAGSYESFESNVNAVFRDEQVAHRLVKGQIVPFYTSEQIETIDTALADDELGDGARSHLQRALAMLRTASPSDTIREVIHAVEAEAQHIAGTPDATLSDALKVIAKSRSINPALKEALSKLYGYASSEKGIRHANDAAMDKATDDDAKFMVLTCSAFLSWLRAHKSETR